MRAGDGRKDGSIRCRLLAACQSKPIKTSGNTLPTGDASHVARSVSRIGSLFCCKRLMPDRYPDPVAHLVEGVRREELFARDGAIEVDREFLDDFPRPRRHHADAV